MHASVNSRITTRIIGNIAESVSCQPIGTACVIRKTLCNRSTAWLRTLGGIVISLDGHNISNSIIHVLYRFVKSLIEGVVIVAKRPF